MKNTMNEIENVIKSINSRVNQTEEKKFLVRGQEFWNYPVKGEQRKRVKKRMKEAYKINVITTTKKRNHLQIIGAPEGEKRETRAEKLF